MVARCSTDAATVFDDPRQAVRNIAFRSDPTLGEIVKPLSPGCSNPARKASPPFM
jgi:hypothetical protein